MANPDPAQATASAESTTPNQVAAHGLAALIAAAESITELLNTTAGSESASNSPQPPSSTVGANPCSHMAFTLQDGGFPFCTDCGRQFTAEEFSSFDPVMARVFRAPSPANREATEFRPDMVNHPPHYKRGPRIEVGTCDEYGNLTGFTRSTVQLGGKLYIDVECIEVIEHIRDGRLFTAMKYLWRVAFGGKADNAEDMDKSVWYHNRWKTHPLDSQPDLPPPQ